MVLEPSDNPIKGNVMMTAYMSMNCKVGETSTPIYGCYDPANKTLTFQSQQIFTTETIGETMYYLMFASSTTSAKPSADPVVFTLSEDGLITDCGYYYGVFAVSQTGSVAGYISVYYTVTSAPYVPTPETSAKYTKSLSFAKGPIKVMK